MVNGRGRSGKEKGAAFVEGFRLRRDYDVTSRRDRGARLRAVIRLIKITA